MRKLTIDEEKIISLNILKKFDLLCKKFDINYFLAYGTLLGAVRHKGFIPWDDDIDLFMFRNDYEKFLQLTSYLPPFYKCINFEDASYYYPFAKIIDTRTLTKSKDFCYDICIGIDIFTLDYLSDNEVEAQRIKGKFKYYEKLIRFSLYNNVNEINKNSINILKSGFYFFSKLLGWKTWSRMLYKSRNKFINMEPKKYIGTFLNFNKAAETLLEREWFAETVFLQFEDNIYPAPKAYHKVLEKIYGDYMTPPSIENRLPHSHESYWVGD